MGCGQSKTVTPGQSELVDQQPGKVKHQLTIAIKRDDPILFESAIEDYNVSLQEKLNDGFDTNWTLFHFAASKNSAKVIETFLEKRLSQSQLSFDIVNARDLAGKTPLEIAYDYSSFEVFETLLRVCAQHQQKVSVKSELVNSLDPESEYMMAIKQYKSQSPISDGPTARTNQAKQEGEYLIILNKGQVNENLVEKVQTLKPNGKFKDKEFCANGIDGENTKSTWVPAKDLLNQDYKIYNKGGFNPNSEISSINPNLNYLLCAFNEFPNCLNRIFTSLQSNEQGYSSMILYSGHPDLVLLDEYFPCTKSKDSFLYQKPFGNEIWPQLVEKGLAKVFGSYSKIASLSLIELLEVTLGAPVKEFKVSDNSIDIFWMTLQDLEQSKYLTFFESKNTKNSYFLLDSIYSVNDKRIIKLKACVPKAKVDKPLADGLLDQETRDIVGYETKEDGWYLVELENFVPQFENIIVSHYNQNWNRTAIAMKECSQKNESFTFEVKKDTKLSLSVSQCISAEGSTCPVHFVLLQKEGSKIKTIAEGDSNCKLGSRTCYIDEEKEVNLQPGNYIVQVKAHSKAKKSQVPATLVIYSPDFIPVTPYSNKKLLEEVFISLGRSNNLKEPCGVRCEFTSGWWSNYYYLYFENNSDKRWEISIKFENLANLKVGKPFRVGTDTLEVVVEMGQKKIAYLQKKNPAKEADVKLDMNHTFI